MWLSLLSRFWPYLAGAALIIGAALYLHHRGYESGYAASEALWQPRFAQAERARDMANEKARRKEEDSTALSAQTEKQHAETLVSLQARASDADKRLRALSVRLAAASTRRCAMPETAGTPAVTDAATASAERAERAGASISDTGRRCELDAATLTEWQRFYSGVRSISNRAD